MIHVKCENQLCLMSDLPQFLCYELFRSNTEFLQNISVAHFLV